MNLLVHKSGQAGEVVSRSRRKRLPRLSSVLLAAFTVLGTLGVSLVLAVAPAGAAPPVLYVAGGGSNASNTCTVAAKPCATISYALTQAAPAPILIDLSGTIDDNINYSGSEPLTITGATASPSSPAVVNGTGIGRVFDLDATVTLDDLTVENGAATSAAGIDADGTVTLNGVTVTGNTATSDGGGIGVYGTSTVVAINDSTITENMADTCSCGDNPGGGGINMLGETDSLTVTGSTVSDNTSDNGYGGGFDDTYGGGLNEVTIMDSTFSNNQVVASGGAGGAIAVAPGDFYGSFELNSSTLTGNTSANGAGIYETGIGISLISDTVAGNSGVGLYVDYGSITLDDTILAGNTGGDCGVVGGYGALNVGSNLIDDGTCGFGAYGNPDLGPLADNGGPTETMMPQAGSPAIGAVPPGSTDPYGPSLCPRRDQREASGPPTGQTNCSIGAVEAGSYSAQSPLSVTSGTGTYSTPLTLATTGGSGAGPVTFTTSDGTASGCAISTSTPYILSSSSAGICEVTATEPGTGDYLSVSSAPTNVTFAEAPQSALSVASTNGTFGTPLTLASSGGSGSGSVNYKVSNGSATGCTVSPSAPYTLSSTSTGTCTVTATKASDGNYLASSSSPTTVTIALAAQPTLVLTSVSGDEGSPLTLTTSGGSGTGAVTFVASDGSATGCAVSDSTPYTLDVSSLGTCTVTATKAGDANYLATSSSPTTVTFANEVQAPLSVTTVSGPYHTPLTLTTTGGSGTGAVTFTAINGTATGCAVIGSGPFALSTTSTGTCTVTATKATDGTYLPISSSPTSVTISEGSQPTLNVTSVNGTYGAPLTLRTSGGGGAGAITYSVVNGSAKSCAVSGTTPYTLTSSTAGTCKVTATKASDGNYRSVSSAPTTVTMAKAPQAGVTLTSLSGTFGTRLTLTATGGSGTGVISYETSGGSASGCAVKGKGPYTLTSTSPGTCVVTATRATDIDYLVGSSVPTPVTLLQSTPSAVLGTGTAQRTLVSGLNYPDGVTTNAIGDIFVANDNGGNVIEYSPSGAVLRTVSAYYPTSVAVDASGDMYIAEPLDQEVLEVTPSGGQIPFDVVGEWSEPQALAVDSSGNLYVANEGNGVLTELTAAGVATTLATGFSNPVGIAVDSAGNVYVAEDGTGEGKVIEVSPDGSETPVGSGLQDPVNVAVDSAGNVYVAEATANDVVQITPNGAQTVIGSGYTYVGGVTADLFGHVFVSDYEGNVLDEISEAPRATDAGTGAAQVTWLPPAYHGTSPITTYKVTATDQTNSAHGGQTCTYKVVTPPTDTCTVKMLTSGDVYTFTVAATNGSGTGPSSALSNAVTAASPPTVTSVSPSSGPISGGTTIIITGTGFSAGAKVMIGKTASATNIGVLSSTTIIAKTGKAPKAGTFDLTVKSGGATSAVNAGGVFTYEAVP